MILIFGLIPPRGTEAAKKVGLGRNFQDGHIFTKNTLHVLHAKYHVTSVLIYIINKHCIDANISVFPIMHNNTFHGR